MDTLIKAKAYYPYVAMAFKVGCVVVPKMAVVSNTLFYYVLVGGIMYKYPVPSLLVYYFV